MTIAGHVDDSALMKSLGEQGFGIFPAPILVRAEVERHYNVNYIGTIDNVISIITPDKLIRDSIYDEFIKHAQTT